MNHTQALLCFVQSQMQNENAQGAMPNIDLY
jgi:hypothetical protein